MDILSFLLLAMSMEDAQRLLGVSPGASDDEIRHAQRLLAIKHHPDRGGDEGTLKEINHAADILLGKSRADNYDRRGPDPTPAPQPYRPPPPEEVVTFAEAKGKAGVPSDVDWVFVTARQRGTGYSSDEFSRSDNFWVAYGKTKNNHVFVAMNHFNKEEYFIGGAGKRDIWKMVSFDAPIHGDEGNQPAWLYNNVVKAFKLVSFGGRFNSKVIDAKGWNFTERMPTGAEVSLKHLLVETGAVSGDDPRVQGRKHVIELKYFHNSMSGEDDTPPPGLFVVDHGSASYKYKKTEGIQILVNGKPYALDQADTQKVCGGRVKFGGKELLEAIFGRYYYEGSTKNLTRMKDGKKILEWMSGALTSLPEAVRNTMKAAVTQ